MAVRMVPVETLPIRAARAHTSPTVLKNLVADIARLREGQRTTGDRLRALGQELRELELKPTDEPGVAEELLRVRREIRELETQRRADAALLKRKLEQLEAVRKGHSPESVDEGKGLRRVEDEAETSPYARLFTADLSSLNES